MRCSLSSFASDDEKVEQECSKGYRHHDDAPLGENGPAMNVRGGHDEGG
jgi:hypothetical protein